MKIILIMMLLGYLFDRLFGVIPRGTLNCGLAGFSGYKGKSVDVTKMRMLLLLNQSTEAHSSSYRAKGSTTSKPRLSSFITISGRSIAFCCAENPMGLAR